MTLKASPLKWLLVGLVSLGIAVAALVVDGGPLLKLGGGGFFAVGGLFAFAHLLPGKNGLRLNQDGFEVRSLFGSTIYKWRDCSDFSVWSSGGKIPVDLILGNKLVPRSKMVVFEHAGGDNGLLGKVNAAYADHNAWIPDTYGLSVGDLAEFLNDWRARALARDATDPDR